MRHMHAHDTSDHPPSDHDRLSDACARGLLAHLDRQQLGLRVPTPVEVRSARQAAGQTQTQAGQLVGGTL